MKFRLILFAILSLNAVKSHEADSSEVNRLDFTPYDTIILSDVADIINEFENNMNTPLDAITSGSESDENVEDLLTEYQRFLDKAHKQKIHYYEKTKAKNKVPPLRRDRFAKTKPISSKYEDYFYSNGYYPSDKYPQIPLSNPIDIFIPMNPNPKLRYFTKFDLTTPQPKDNGDDFSVIEKKLLELPSVYPSPKWDPIKSTCLCKKPQLPCDCKCKQCLLPLDTIPQNYMQHGDNTERQNSEYITEDHSKDSDNTLNIRIKVDIQLPKTQETIGRFFNNRARENTGISKESSLNLPFPYLNFPIPMDVFGYKRMSKASHDPGHKTSLHKKKKSRISSGSNKHRKKIVNFDSFNIQPQTSMNIQPYVEKNFNWTDANVKFKNTNQVTANNTLATHKLETNVSSNESNTVNTTTAPSISHETQTEESIFVMVNITNGSNNTTEDVHKIENSVENEFQKVETNVATEKLSSKRKKREISKKKIAEKPSKKVTNHTNQKIIKKNTNHKTSPPTKRKVAYTKSSSTNATGQNYLLMITNEPNKRDNTKKSDKLITDSELVYWPTILKNQSNVHSKNITTIILERENKKAKVNMTKEAIRNNRTTALEKAIFGDINWNDVDTVAPVFMSFVGKYLRGVLTFCSQNVCHSMNCADKTCVHRLCIPNDRWNHRGHCSGSNDTDSVASLESIMDLPSNVAFEIVDILQDKMLGKLFGKMTLCISPKCISFVASKKKFLKSKCSVKELNTGHCPNIKNFKVM